MRGTAGHVFARFAGRGDATRWRPSDSQRDARRGGGAGSAMGAACSTSARELARYFRNLLVVQDRGREYPAGRGVAGGAGAAGRDRGAVLRRGSDALSAADARSVQDLQVSLQPRLHLEIGLAAAGACGQACSRSKKRWRIWAAAAPAAAARSASAKPAPPPAPRTDADQRSRLRRQRLGDPWRDRLHAALIEAKHAVHRRRGGALRSRPKSQWRAACSSRPKSSLRDELKKRDSEASCRSVAGQADAASRSRWEAGTRAAPPLRQSAAGRRSRRARAGASGSAALSGDCSRTRRCAPCEI